MTRTRTTFMALMVGTAVASGAYGQNDQQYRAGRESDQWQSQIQGRQQPGRAGSQTSEPYYEDRSDVQGSPQSRQRQEEDQEAYQAQQQRLPQRLPQGPNEDYGDDAVGGRYQGQADDRRGEQGYDARFGREFGETLQYGRDEQQPQRATRSPLNQQRRQSDGRRDALSQWGSEWWSDSQSPGASTDIDAENARQFIRQHDQDDDGYLSWSELPRDLRTQFNALDRNGDGYLSERELQTHALSHARARIPVEVTYIWIVGADRGRVSLDDLNRAYSLLGRIDQDGDGYITRGELRDRQQQVLAQWINQAFDRLDRDGDGRISRQEARGSILSSNFAQIDEDGDDLLSYRELREALAQQQEQAIAAEEPGRSRTGDRFSDPARYQQGPTSGRSGRLEEDDWR